MNRLFVIVGTMFLLLMVVAGCTPQQPDAESSVPANGAMVTVEAATAESPLATPRAMVSMLPTVTPITPPANLDEVQPEAGKAAVYGRVISSRTSMPIANTPVRLAEIYYADETKDPATAAWALNNASSPFAYSDENGVFVFESVPPQDYIVFVGDMEGKYAVATKEDGFPQDYRFEPDSVTDLGELSIDY